jgi:hypothetical protein
MLRSLPVSDPALLYRIGDGDDCCVEGGPQGRWGMFSFPLYEHLKSNTPELSASWDRVSANYLQNFGVTLLRGLMRDAKFADFALRAPARPMFCAPLAQTVTYQNL